MSILSVLLISGCSDAGGDNDIILNEIGSWERSDGSSGSCQSLFVTGSHAYVSIDTGLQIIDVSVPSSPSLTSTYDTPGYTESVYVLGNYAYIIYYIPPLDTGLQIIDISNPLSPTLIGSITAVNHSFNDVYVEDNYAYIIGGDRFYIIDISVPSSPSVIGGYYHGEHASGGYVSGNYAYLACGVYSFTILDFSHLFDSYNPYAYEINYDEVYHSFNVFVSGNYAYADSILGFTIIDISTPLNPSLAGTCNMGAGTRGVFVSGNYAYAANYNSGLQVIDVSDPSSPYLAGTYDTSGNANGVYEKDNYVYVINESAAKALVIYEIQGN